MYEIRQARKLEGEVDLIGDKSISHRAVMFGSIAEGETRIKNFANSQDCLSTADAFKQMGIDINIDGDRVIVLGKGLLGLKKPNGPVYVGNSGTTMRMLLGILAGQSFDCTLTGDRSLSSRPMSRVVNPLRQMGAQIDGRERGEFAPLAIKGAKLRPIVYDMPISSAQVKSSILLGGLYADGITTVREKVRSRDHTERMLKLFGADLKVEGLSVSIKGRTNLKGQDIEVPNDISGASFFIVGATLLKGSGIKMKSVLYNPTRTGVLEVLRKMGANIEIKNEKTLSAEPVCDLEVLSGELHGIEITPEMIPSLIDEIPIIMVAASLAKGKTVIRGAKELRVKETDRIKSLTTNLIRMKAQISVEGDDITINGSKELQAADLQSYGDHRTAMSMIIAALTAKGVSNISDVACIDISFPGFLDILKNITR